MQTLQRYFKYFKQSVQEFIEDDSLTMAAALAYYTILSLPAMLLILVAVVGIVFGRAAVEGEIQQQIQGTIGPGAAEQVQTMIQKQSENTSGTVLGLTFGVLALLFSATTAFAQLQSSLNKVWEVQPAAEGGVKSFLVKRLWSFLMLIGIGALLLVSLAISAILPALGQAAGFLPFSSAFMQALYFVVSLAIMTLLFAAIFKVLPDTRIAWREVWVGAFTTAVLFVIARFLIGLYIGRSAPASAFGAAGSLVLLVLWIYYASTVVLFGAEFTQVWAREHGRRIEPAEGPARTEEPPRRPREAA
jgi:membrane protein